MDVGRSHLTPLIPTHENVVVLAIPYSLWCKPNGPLRHKLCFKNGVSSQLLWPSEISSFPPRMTRVRILHPRYSYFGHLAGIVDWFACFWWRACAADWMKSSGALKMLWVRVWLSLLWSFFFAFFWRYVLHCGVHFWGLLEGHSFSSALLLGSRKDSIFIDFKAPSLNLCLRRHETTVFTQLCFPGLYPWTCLTISFACSVAFLSHFMSLRQQHLNCQTCLCTNALARISQRLNRLSCCFTQTLSWKSSSNKSNIITMQMQDNTE